MHSRAMIINPLTRTDGWVITSGKYKHIARRRKHPANHLIARV